MKNQKIYHISINFYENNLWWLYFKPMKILKNEQVLLHFLILFLLVLIFPSISMIYFSSSKKIKSLNAFYFFVDQHTNRKGNLI
jgi:uncharacterized protein (UPF0333 family)